MLMLLTLMGFLATADQSWTVGKYKVETAYEKNGERRLSIVKGGAEVYSKTAGQFWFISASKGKGKSSYDPVASDVTGDGVPDLVLETFPRSGTCCWSYTIVSLGTQVKEVASAGGFPSPMDLQDVNGDGVYEITGDDWSFYSWYASPRFVLRNDKGEFHLASHLMRRPAPTRAELTAKAAEFRKATVYAGFPVAPEVYRYMLDLIYSGNDEAAWAFLDMAWPKQNPGKKEFLESFKQQLAKSPFWPEILAMNQRRTVISE
jgi:hypothetical protein